MPGEVTMGVRCWPTDHVQRAIGSGRIILALSGPLRSAENPSAEDFLPNSFLMGQAGTVGFSVVTKAAETLAVFEVEMDSEAYLIGDTFLLQ